MNMTEAKNPPEFYAARDDVEGGLIPKRNMRTLRKHRAALLVRRSWEDNPLTAEACDRKAQWLAKVEKEIENRKTKQDDLWKDIVLRVGCTLIAGLFLFFLTRMLLNHTTQTTQELGQQPQTSRTTNSSVQSYTPPFTNIQNNASNHVPQDTSFHADPEH